MSQNIDEKIVYAKDLRPSTAKKIDSIVDIISEIAKAEYERGKEDEKRWWSGFCANCADGNRPQGEWIPCSERLPNVFQKAVVCNIHGGMMIGAYTEFGWMFPCYFEKPIAWMPLPEPWKGADYE